MLRNRLVCGIFDKRVQRQFLQEATLTYDGALGMALAAESAARDSKRLHEQLLEVPIRQPEQSTEDKSIHHVG